MPTKPSDLLKGIPSVAELLDKPPIRALADRWNRSVVAGGVRSFLDELRSDLQRRAAEIQLPSARELAERAARHVVAMQTQSLRSAINASGRFQGVGLLSCPLPDEALERLFGLGRDFVVGPCGVSAGSTITAEVANLICRMTQAQSATAVHSYSGAVWLALTALASHREVLVAHGELGDVDSERSLPQLAASTGAILKEIGTTNRATAADYQAAISPQTAAFLKVSADGYQVVGETAAVDLDELVRLARERQLSLIVALGAAPLCDMPPELSIERRSARGSLAAGADLVVVRGDGLVGGPQCGLICGSRELVARITAHPLHAAWQLDALRAAALAAALEHNTNTSQGAMALPILRLLTTPVENLRDRAERLAPQMGSLPGIASAESIAMHSPLFTVSVTKQGLPSYGIALEASEGAIHNLDRRLLSASRPVVGRVEGDRLFIDLRMVFPRQDHFLVEAVAAGKLAKNAEVPDTHDS